MEPASESHDYRARLEPVFRGQRFVLIGGTIAGLAGLGRELVELGAEAPFLLGVSAAGAPDEQEFAWHALEPPARDTIEATWRYEAALDALPPSVQARIDAWDPERRARACGYVVLGAVDRVAGRERYAGRPRAWAALEDIAWAIHADERIPELGPQKSNIGKLPRRSSRLRWRSGGWE